MAKNSVGIYISSKFIDIVELSGSVHSPTLVNFVRQEIPPILSEDISAASEEQDQTEGEPVKDLEQDIKDTLSLLIKEALGKISIPPQGAYGVLSSTDAMIRYFDMPVLPKSEQPQAVKFESKKYIPFKLEDVVSDFKTLATSKDKKNTHVFFIAATKQRIESHLTMFKNANLDTLGIDIVPFTLMRMVLLTKKAQPKDTIATLYLGNDKETASIHIMEEGMPFLSRDIKVSTDDKDALFEKLASEIRVSLDYYHRQRSQVEVSKIIVCGEHLFAGLDAYIADELKIITETISGFEGLRNGETADPSAVVAIGAALGGLGKSNYSINLSPAAAKIKQKKVTSILFIEALVAAAVIVAVFLFGSLRTAKVAGELKAVQQEGATLPKETKGLSLEALEKLKKGRINEIEMFKVLVNDRILWADKLSNIANLIPKGIWIEKLALLESSLPSKYNPLSSWARTILLEGRSFLPQGDIEEAAIDSFFKTLKGNKKFLKGFDEIELGSSEKTNVSGNQVSLFSVVAYKAKKLTEQGRSGRSRWRRR